MPTALERQGDFSQSTDNNGNPFPYIKDFTNGLACVTTATGDHSGCFQDGGVLGKIPANRLYQIGLNILNMYPSPNLTNIPATQVYNFELTRPTQSITAWQPAIRIDYQPLQALRVTFKYSAWGQPRDVVVGSLPGFNDTIMNHPSLPLWSSSVNYNLNSTTFLEATVGHTQHHQAGCALNGNGANFCTAGFPVNPVSSRANTGLTNLPLLFQDSNIIDPSYYEYAALNAVDSAPWNGTRYLLPPNSMGRPIGLTASNNSYPGLPITATL